jgi:pimeloyl-ACP methyl ester carboxylesterase
MRASGYFGDLGGLSAHRSLVLLDLRGTGDSAIPADPATYRCDHQVDDLEALRGHLGLRTLDLLGHSAGGVYALLYAARYPERVGSLVLVAPSVRVVDIEITDEDRREVAELRRGEPWFAAAFAAFERIWSGVGTEADWDAITPFMYGRSDAAAQGRANQDAYPKNEDAAAAYYAPGAIDPAAVRSALGALDAPVLLIAGEYDAALPPKRATEYADLFARAELAILPGAGHNPWLDDPDSFVELITRFAAETS